MHGTRAYLKRPMVHAEKPRLDVRSKMHVLGKHTVDAVGERQGGVVRRRSLRSGPPVAVLGN